MAFIGDISREDAEEYVEEVMPILDAATPENPILEIVYTGREGIGPSPHSGRGESQ